MSNWLWIFIGQVGRLAEIVVCLVLSWGLLIDLLTFIWNGVVSGGGVDYSELGILIMFGVVSIKAVGV